MNKYRLEDYHRMDISANYYKLLNLQPLQPQESLSATHLSSDFSLEVCILIDAANMYIIHCVKRGLASFELLFEV